MQTNFSEEQLKDPRLAEANDILRRCVHCGFCTATCSTYVLLGDERDSPRGRIYLMKEMFESGDAASREVTFHVDRCLSCLSCVTTCPSGVDYMHLVDLARTHIQDTGQRPIGERALRRVLRAVLPYPERLRFALVLAMIARPLKGLLRTIGFASLASMLELAPAAGPQLGRYHKAVVIPAEGKRTKRVVLLTGCAQQPLRPSINDATVRLLTRHGVEVVTPIDQGCCGALVHHMGCGEEAEAQARRNIDAWRAVMEVGPLDAIVINASGCGTMVKDYAHLLRLDKAYADAAAQMSALTCDITEFALKLDLDSPSHWSDLKVAYHSACSMQHGQNVNAEPRALLERVGYTVLEIPEGHICCGSAGTYNILQPELARELRERKQRNIESVRPDLVAAGNIGCIAQLQQGGSIPVVHTVELIDWALGGPCPRELSGLQGRVRKVRDLVHASAA